MAEFKLKKIILYVITFALVSLLCLNYSQDLVRADDEVEYSYKYEIIDTANLLTEAEEFMLSETMEKCSKYANVAFVSIDINGMSTQSMAESLNKDMFSSNGIVFLIDMQNRYMYLDSTGAARTYVTNSNGESITDNVYQYASAGDYYKCANSCFLQVLNLMEGRSIAKPMKYVGNAVIALVIGFFIFYLVVKKQTRMQATSNAQMMAMLKPKFDMYNTNSTFVRQTRVYHSSGGGGGHGGGGGGGGGGGHSGGGHGF